MVKDTVHSNINYYIDINIHRTLLTGKGGVKAEPLALVICRGRGGILYTYNGSSPVLDMTLSLRGTIFLAHSHSGDDWLSPFFFFNTSRIRKLLYRIWYL